MRNLIIKLNILILLVVLSSPFLGTKVAAESSYSECQQIMSMIAKKPNEINEPLAKAALFCLDAQMIKTQNRINDCLDTGNISCVQKMKFESNIAKSIESKLKILANKDGEKEERNIVAKATSDYKKI